MQIVSLESGFTGGHCFYEVPSLISCLRRTATRCPPGKSLTSTLQWSNGTFRPVNNSLVILAFVGPVSECVSRGVGWGIVTPLPREPWSQAKNPKMYYIIVPR